MTKQYKPGDKLTTLKELVGYLSGSSERRAHDADGARYHYRMANGFMECRNTPTGGWVRSGACSTEFPFRVLPDAEPEKRYLTDINELKQVTKVRIHWPEWAGASFSELDADIHGEWPRCGLLEIDLALRNGWKVEVLEAKEAV